MRITVTAFALCAIIASCSKTDESKPATRREILISHDWTPNSVKINGSQSMEICDYDNYLTFLANGSAIENVGTVKCEDSEPQTNSFTYSFDSGENYLALNGFAGLNLNMEITQFTSEKISLRQNVTSGGSPALLEVDFIKK